MTYVYKLTDQNMQTYEGCQWELGVEKTTDGEGQLCGPGWLHCYSDPVLAIMLNPIHANFSNPRLFKAKVRGLGKHDKGRKSGYTAMTLVEEMDIPAVTTVNRVAFGILCVMEVYKNPEWVKWAESWLSNTDRSKGSASAAYADAYYAAYAAAAYAAHAAAYADTHDAAHADACYAAYAANAAAADDIDLAALAHKAMEVI